MKIEVAVKKGDSTKSKGDLLEKLSKKLLEAQGYSVIEEIRIIGAELDLLCKHKVNGKEIYVECKAQKDNIPAPILRQLWGTVDSEDYSEGWLITTSDFTKDAKGFSEKWKLKPKDKSCRLSFYTPDKIIESLIDSSIILTPPVSNAEDFITNKEFLGEWLLLVSPFGIYWCVYTLKGGAPDGILVYNATNNRMIDDEETLQNLNSLDSTISSYNLFTVNDSLSSKELEKKNSLPVAVPVQIGESWNDYRPARPEDFVGRDEMQKNILNFINLPKDNNGSRVFAITGNSGLGKSSLIAKLRARSRNKHYKKRFFIYAVDIRAAKSPSYIISSLLTCIKEAQANNFGDTMDITLTNPSTPLSSPSIISYLDSLDIKKQVICLIFDQFEELYSKPELFEVFNAAKSLMLEIAGIKRNITLGFAWKTDSTTQQDHPAYHMWHELADHRKEYRLEVFNNGEINKSITTFEKEINQKLTADTRHQILHSSQGFPWLLKKLCINLYDSIIKGEGSDSSLNDLDVGRLFESDTEKLTPNERTCLNLIAHNAPADWSEIIEISGVSTLNSLVHKRLVIRSGDRLNIYWDIFKDFLLTKKIPIIPFNYIPTSDPSTLINISKKLVYETFKESKTLAQESSLNEKTIWNVGADLVMFGLAERDGVKFKLHQNIPIYNQEEALCIIRKKIGKHSLKISLYKKYAGKTITSEQIKSTLIECLPSAKYGEKTWRTYSNKLLKFLIYCGFISRVGNDYIVQDSGAPVSMIESYPRRSKVFSVSVSPFAVISTLESISNGITKTSEVSRNSLAVLRRFEIVSIIDNIIHINYDLIKKHGGNTEAIWSISKNEQSLLRCIEIYNDNSSTSNKSLAEAISKEYNLGWSEGSIKRNGGILNQWSSWIKEGSETSTIPNPPGRPLKI